MKKEERQGLIFLHLGDQSIEEDTKNGEDDPKNTRNVFGLESFKVQRRVNRMGDFGRCDGAVHPSSSSSFLVLCLSGRIR